jgi:hypothetical protein
MMKNPSEYRGAYGGGADDHVEWRGRTSGSSICPWGLVNLINEFRVALMPPRRRVWFLLGGAVSSSILWGYSETERLLEEVVDDGLDDDDPFFFGEKACRFLPWLQHSPLQIYIWGFQPVQGTLILFWSLDFEWIKDVICCTKQAGWMAKSKVVSDYKLEHMNKELDGRLTSLLLLARFFFSALICCFMTACTFQRSRPLLRLHYSSFHLMFSLWVTSMLPCLTCLYDIPTKQSLGCPPMLVLACGLIRC